MAQAHGFQQQQGPANGSVSHRVRSLCSCTVTCIITVVCLPCICVVGSSIGIAHLYRKARTYERPKTRERKWRERQEKERTRRTPWKLGLRDDGSELTLPLPAPMPEPETEMVRATDNQVLDEKFTGKKRCGCEERKGKVKKKVTNEQELSSLFKFPLEIRRQIYDEVLSGYVFHIYFKECYRKMNARRCRTPKPEICEDVRCKKMFKVPGARDEWGNVGLLPLLMSCRRVYSEAIEVLYKSNTFNFDMLQTLLQFSMTVLPERLRLIQSVHWKKSYYSSTYYHVPPWNDCTMQPRCGCAICIAGEMGIDYALAIYGAM